MNADTIKSTPAVYFYIPSQELVDHVPATIQEYWKWINEAVKTSPAPLASGEGLCTWVGPYNWTIQTFINLRTSGFPCELTASLPAKGIIITHGDFLPRLLRPGPRQFVVEIKPDRSLQCIYANFVIVQNRHDPILSGIKTSFFGSAFVNYWPQPGLIPRDPMRGERFENICFIGNPEQFLSDVDLLESEVRKLGLQWKSVPRERWHDYSEIDAVVAVRPADAVGVRQKAVRRLFIFRGADVSPILSPDRKPATKLYNAWLAGTPAILSPDIAFEDIRTSELDYLEAKDIPEIIERLRQLQSDPALRMAMIENGRKKSVEYAPEKVVQEWVDIIENRIIPAYVSWTKSSAQRNLFFFIRAVLYKAKWNVF
jgi:hypothetical protein